MRALGTILGLLLTALITTPPGDLAAQPTTSDSEQGQIRIQVTDHQGLPIRNFHLDRTRLPLTQWSREIHVRQETARYFADQEWANLRPKTPQTFHSYRRVTPQLWCQVLTPESEGTELITTVTIAPGDTTVATSSLPSGRYLIRCGTTIQVDAVDAIDTGIEAKSVDKTSSNFPQVPLGGVDDRGRWETARLLDISTKQYETKMGMPEQRYTYRILKRYTYNTVSTTITHLAPGETDRAFVPLLTHPDALATLSEQLAESRRIADFDLQESATNQTVQGLLSSGLEETFKASLPTPSGAVGPGLLAGEVANLVYLGTTQPSTELDEQFLLRFGADIAVSALSIKVATAAGSAGGPAGTAAGLAVGVAVGTAVDQVISSYFESRVRGLVGEAFFDDLTASVSEVTSGQLSVQINCLGLKAGQLQLNTATPNNRSQPKSTCEGALSSATFPVPYTGDPQHFLSGCGPSLVANVPIVHGSSERLRLSTCLSDLVAEVPESPSPPDPQPVEPAASSTMLVIDTSGSMEWEDPTGMAKIDAAKDAARRFVDMVETENRRHGTSHEIGIVQFNTSASVPLSPSRQTGQARNVIADLDVDGGTNMAQGLQLANNELRTAAPDAERIIILLSDGVPTISSSGQEKEPDELEAELLQGPVARAARNGTCLYVVGFGRPGVTRDETPSIDPDFLRALTQATNCGQYHTARDADELRRVYTRLRHQTLGTIVGKFGGSIRQGDMADAGSFDVPAGQDELHFSLSWPGSRLEPILIDPQGRRVDDDYPGASVAIRASLAQVIVNDPLPGRWHAKIYGRDVREGRINFDATASIRGSTSRSQPTNTTSNRNCTTVREAGTGVQLQACGSDQWIAWFILGLLVLISAALEL